MPKNPAKTILAPGLEPLGPYRIESVDGGKWSVRGPDGPVATAPCYDTASRWAGFLDNAYLGAVVRSAAARTGLEPDMLRDLVNVACAEIGREVGIRSSVYPRWVKSGKLTQEAADMQVAGLELAANLLRVLSGVQR